MKQDHRHIADQIDLIGRNVATFYEPVVADMHQVRMQARHFEQLTDSLKSASQSSSLTPDAQSTNSVLEAATCLRDAIGKARETVSDTRLQNIFDRMQSHCDQLLRYSKELNSLSFLMLVTTANAASSGFSVDHLVSDLREMSRQLNTASSDIISTLGVVNGVRQETGKVLLDTYNLIDGGLDGFDHSATTQVSDHGDNTTVETPEKMAEKLSRNLAQLLPGLVACMQHPDAFAQRCDHVAQATRLLDQEVNEDTDLALRKLICAQLDDICEELNRIQADALNTLSDIAAKGTGTLKLFQHHLKNDTRLDEIRAEKKEGHRDQRAAHTDQRAVSNRTRGTLRLCETV